MRLDEYKFGFADATKEYTRLPEMFETAFCDSKGIVDKLLNSYQFLLIGRKGVGKSAYSAKIQSMAQKSDVLYTFTMNMNDFEFSTFAKTAIDEDVTGTKKYKVSWDFLLLLTIFKKLYNDMQIVEDEKITDVLNLIDIMGFSLDAGYKDDVTKLSKLKVGIGIAKFDLEFEKVFHTKPQTYIERISSLVDKMLDVLSTVYLNDREILIIIDGMDDILRYKKNKVEIISSLIRSIDNINDKMLVYNKKIKIVLLLRDDIISMVNDPDLNKIVQDGSLSINWSKRLMELKEIVKKRFEYSGLSTEEADNCWESIFPRKIKNKLSWDYVLEYTLYKPRDILQFLKYCQIEYPGNKTLGLAETQNVLKSYSAKYFIEELKNELAGFIDDEIIYAIPSVFKKLGGRSFKVSDINKILTEQVIRKDITIDDTKMLISRLYDSGYVGQIIISGKGKDAKKLVTFKYRNPTARIDFYQEFITHKGLHSGLGVRK